jgi:glycosyltransferase involved in cell wall biosynthesis
MSDGVIGAGSLRAAHASSAESALPLGGALAVPAVSICVITYNQAPYIRQCLDSILAQDIGESFEVIVGDDCSTDGTRDIIDDYVVRYPGIVRLLPAEENRGATANYFATHAEAKGEFVAHIDGDDYCLPGKLRAQLDAMQRHPECAVCAHDCLVFDEATGRIEANHFFRKRLKVNRQNEALLDISFLATHLPFFAHSTKMYRRSAAEGLIYEGREMIDCHWHLYHAGRGSIVYINTVLGAYRRGVGVSHASLAVQVPSQYLRDMFEDSINYGVALGIPRATLNRSAARTYGRWAVKFALAGQMETFRQYAAKSRNAGRIAAYLWIMEVLAPFPSVSRRLARLGIWGMRFWNERDGM